MAILNTDVEFDPDDVDFTASEIASIIMENLDTTKLSITDLAQYIVEATTSQGLSDTIEELFDNLGANYQTEFIGQWLERNPIEAKRLIEKIDNSEPIGLLDRYLKTINPHWDAFDLHHITWLLKKVVEQTPTYKPPEILYDGKV